MIYTLNGIAYRFDPEAIALVKMARRTKVAPGQLSLFDEQAHPRDEGGKFTSKGGGTGAKRSSEGAAKKFVARLKAVGYERRTKEDAAYYGLDHQHPGTHWDDGDPDSKFSQFLDVYREKGAAALGEEFKKTDFANEEGMWGVAQHLAKEGLETVDWEEMATYGKHLLEGGNPADFSHGPAQVMSSQIEHMVGLWQEDEEEGDRALFDSPDALKEWAMKELTNPAYDESGISIELAEAHARELDSKEIGEHFAAAMKFPQAIAHEQKTGRKGAIVTDPEQTDFAKDQKAWEKFDPLVDWERVASAVQGKGSPQNKHEQLAVNLLKEEIANDPEVAKSFNSTSDKAYAAKSKLRGEAFWNIRQHPAIRQHMESHGE